MCSLINCLGAVGSFLSGICAVVLIFVAYKQLAGLKNSIDSQNLMVSFNIECELTKLKQKVASLSLDMEKINDNSVLVFDGYRREALEDFYNLFDSLCYRILCGFLDEKLFKTQYQEMLSNVITGGKKFGFFELDTPYKNMLKLNNKWQPFLTKDNNNAGL